MKQDETQAAPARMRRRPLMLAAGGTILSGLAGRKSSPARAAGPALQTPDALKPQAVAPVPPLAFTDASGALHHIADYAGRPVLFNLWATWCGPCVAELPSLARFAPQAEQAGITVLPVSIDHGGTAAVQAFFASHGIARLPVLADPHAAALAALGLTGIPATLLIDARGMIRARLDGSLDWGTPAVLPRLRRLLA